MQMVCEETFVTEIIMVLSVKMIFRGNFAGAAYCIDRVATLLVTL